MRFSVVAIFAGAAMVSAHHGHGGDEPVSTEYTTDYETVTSCEPTVHDCPAESTVVTSKVYPVYTSTVYSTNVYTVTSCPPEKTDCPVEETVEVTEVVAVSTTVCPYTPSPTPYANTTVEAQPYYPTVTLTSSAKPFSTGVSAPSEAVCPEVSVKTIHTSVTTVVPTVIYETVSIPCPTTTEKVVPSASACYGANCTAAAPAATVVTAGAGSIGGSLFLAAVVGIVAVVMA